MKISKWSQADNFSGQSEIIRKSLATSDHSLNALLDLMRKTGQASVYLSGSRLDNEFCFGSSDVGLLLSALPEDSTKAAEPGYHPGSTETYVTFQGSLVMEYLEDGTICDVTVGNNNPLVLPPGRCHRVRYNGEQKTASVITKTNLAHQPGVVRCDGCTYYDDRNSCPLYQSWKTESRP